MMRPMATGADRAGVCGEDPCGAGTPVDKGGRWLNCGPGSLTPAATFTQPADWDYAEGLGVGFAQNITVEIWFAK